MGEPGNAGQKAMDLQSSRGEDEVQDHFNTIAEKYFEAIPGHIREHVINKWWQLVKSHFPQDGLVLDVGCGDGLNLKFLRDKGINVHGIDFSAGLIATGKQRWPDIEPFIAEGSALDLDYNDDSFDAVYMIGVLHHINTRSDQRKAVGEALRVVKPGGRVLIRESNLKNPLFRIFWNYVFPLTAKIDLFGGEHWVPPSLFRKWGYTIDQLLYFTFLPSFTAPSLLPLVGRVESFLERTPLRSLAAHYVVVLSKD